MELFEEIVSIGGLVKENNVGSAYSKNSTRQYVCLNDV